MKDNQAPQHFPLSGGAYQVKDGKLVRETDMPQASEHEPDHKKHTDIPQRHSRAKG